MSWLNLSQVYADLQRMVAWQAVLAACLECADDGLPVIYHSRIDGCLLADER